MEFDVIIIGSGVAGVQCAVPLVERGLNVLMLDGGNQPDGNILEQPVDDYLTMRRTRTDQGQWFYGQDYSNIPLQGLDGGHGGGMIGGNRAYVSAETETELPIHTDSQTKCVQSLARGGLAAAWGAACVEYDDQTLQALGVAVTDIRPYYKDVIADIGVSGTGADMQPPLKLDHHARAMMSRYERKHQWFDAKELTVVQPPAAVLTLNLGNRRATEYKDMDYYSDEGRSIYRPQWTIDTLETKPNFTYRGNSLVQQIRPESSGYTVHGIDRQSQKKMSWEAHKVVCAAGAIGTARLLLQSYDDISELPLHAKPHSYIVCSGLSMLGNPGDERRSSLCQLVLIDNHKHNGVAAGNAQLYSYRSLQLFRLLNSVPLGTKAALGFLKHFAPSVVLADVRYSCHNHLTKIQQHGDTLLLSSDVPATEHEQRRATDRRICAGLRQLGYLPLRTLHQPEGSSSHYAGSVPMNDTSKSLWTETDGSLCRDNGIFIADSSAFAVLPALPPTLTIMAYARYVAENVARQLS